MLRSTRVLVSVPSNDFFAHTKLQESPDGKKLVFARRDKVVVCDIETGAELRTLNRHSGDVHCVVITSDSSKVVSSSWDRMVIVWDLNTGEVLRVLQDHAMRIIALTLAMYGNMLAIGNNNGTIHIWDLSTFTRRGIIDRIQAMGSMQFTTKGHLLTASMRPDTLYIRKLWLLSDLVEAFCGGYPGDAVVWGVRKFLPQHN